MFGPGKPSKQPSILALRELAPGEAQAIASVSDRPSSRIKSIRDSHHRLARLMAMGLRSSELAELSGYSAVRVSILRSDPAFMELVEHYRDIVNEGWKEEVDEYYGTVAANRTIAARLINDRLAEAEPDDISLKELIAIHSDSADRTGYPKRTVAVNVNVDFAAKLDRAIKRSQTVLLEGTDPPCPTVPSPLAPPLRELGEASSPSVESRPPLRRRA